MRKFIYKIKFLKAKFLQKLGNNTIYYINSPQTLPPPLSKEEEQKLTEDNANGDRTARDKLVEHNFAIGGLYFKKI